MIVVPQIVNKMQETDPLISSLYVTDIGYFPHAENHFRERPEGIEQNVLLYCVEGSGFYRIGEKEHRLNAGQFAILPEGTPHAYGSSEAQPWTIYWIHFSGTQSAYFAEGASTPQEVHPELGSRIHDRNAIFEEIFQALEKGYGVENLRYVSALLHYYLASIRFLKQYRGIETKKEDRIASEDIVAQTVHYMMENLELHLTLAQMAEYVGYSVPRFCEVFRNATGHSALGYFNLLKVQAACRMLDETNMKVNQICCKVGIDDCYYFTRLFTRIMGMSPRKYRNREK